MLQRAIHISFLFLTFCWAGSSLYAQNVDLDNALVNFRKKYEKSAKLKISGGLNLSSTYAGSSAGGQRDPFVYALNGNINFSFLNIIIPVSMNLTNGGFSYSYQYPRLPSRISIHPKYKSVQVHLGDFSMNFSPYTMSGFQIVGAGMDVQPKGKWKFSGFYGRFQKAVPYISGNGNTLAAYKRTGAGVKIGLTGQAIQTAFSFIRIRDLQHSLLLKPDSVNVFPKSNLAIAIENKWKITKLLQFDFETGISFLTNDVRATKENPESGFRHIIGLVTPVNAASNFYKAFKTSLSYTLGSSNVGIGYERVDPGYQTLGAYYFTNDLENITVNFAQQLFKSKVNLSMNAGMQRDDLNGEKTGRNTRLVTAINASINGGKTFTSSLSYSNFTTVTNVKPQFQYINQLTPYDNLDTLDYQQLSQTANANFNFILRADKEKSNILNLNLSFQDSYDQQGGIITKGNASQFYNLAASYASNLLSKNITTAYGFNATYNTIDTTNMITAGPTLMLGKTFFDKKLRANFSAAYNIKPAAKTKAARGGIGQVQRHLHAFEKAPIGIKRGFYEKKHKE